LEETKVGKEIDLPLKKSKGILGRLKTLEIKGDTSNQSLPDEIKPIEPIALIIKDNFDVEIRENVPEGIIKIERKLAEDKTETVRILNPKSKILSFNWGNTTLRGWIIDEKEAVALPTDVKHDSWELKRIFDALVMNYKSMDDNSKNKWWFYIIVGIVVIFLGSALFGVPIGEIIFGKAAQPVTQVIVNTADKNIMPIVAMMKPF